MDPDIQSLLDQVTADEAVESSALTLINGIQSQIATAVANASSLSPADRANLEAKVTEIKTNSDALAAAIAANTPAAPPADGGTPAAGRKA